MIRILSSGRQGWPAGCVDPSDSPGRAVRLGPSISDVRTPLRVKQGAADGCGCGLEGAAAKHRRTVAALGALFGLPRRTPPARCYRAWRRIDSWNPSGMASKFHGWSAS